MNIFVLGWAHDGEIEPAPARAALGSLLAELPFELGADIAEWRSPDGCVAAAWASHAPELVGGVRYACVDDDRLALFSGRPIAWTSAGADGRTPLDPARYLAPATEWAPGLDGRAAVASAAPGRLDVWSDPLGAYPLHVLDRAGVRWISNNAELLRRIDGSHEMDRSALAGLLGGGWPLDGHPVWSGVRRLPSGPRSLGEARARDPAPPALGMGLDAERAASALVEALRALADWPGRPSVVPVTGGRDSRVVVAAARAAGIQFTTTTGGSPEDDDVRIGAELARWAGVPHTLIERDPGGDVWSQPRRAARTLMLTCAGTASLADAAGFPLASRPEPLPLWHTGQGGEIGRAYYPSRHGRRRALVALERAYTGRRPGRRPPLNAEGTRLVREGLEAWAGEQLTAGARAPELGDLFYLTRRMGTWAGATHSAVEWVRDSTSALWSRRVVPHLLAPGRHERQAERFHREVLALLAPELLELPLAGSGWRSRSRLGRRAARAGRLARRAAAGARGRVARPAGATEPAGIAASDPFAELRTLVAAKAAADPAHPAFDVLDRARVAELLGVPSPDTMRRYYVLRLATVFLGDAE